MKASILAMIALAVCGATHASEIPVRLSSKVLYSDLVAVVKLKSVKNIGLVKQGGNESMRMQFVFSVDKVLKGIAGSEVTVVEDSVSFTFEGRGRWVSAGFRGDGLKVGEEFIGYLKKVDGRGGLYSLTGNSNQFLERIHRDNDEVAGVGQDGSPVGLAEKLKEIRHIVSKEPREISE